MALTSRRSQLSTSCAAVLLAACASPAWASPSGSGASSELPGTLALTGVVRDFKERTVSGGHPDFERQPTRGFAHYAGQVADSLDGDGKPAMASTGFKVTAQARDASGRNIHPVAKDYIQARSGDVRGATERDAGGSTTTSANFAQWFRDVPGVNISQPVTINLVRQNGSNVYSFNDRSDPNFSSLGGFFPINGQLFGNSGGATPSRNHHFTFELTTTFTYKRGSGQVFTFTGDDDVYVFIGGKCVIDLGGVHGAISQTIDLDRLTHLTDGQDYELKLFFAERHRTQSNMRIDTTLTLKTADLPATTMLFD